MNVEQTDIDDENDYDTFRESPSQNKLFGEVHLSCS